MKKICISAGWTFRDGVHEKKVVDLPHDFLIENPRNPESVGWARNGFYDGANGDYTKYLTLDGEHVILDVDGAYMCARVYLNENLLYTHPYGYTPFLVDLTDGMRRGKSNKIHITTQNLQPSTRWYSGAGLYRDVFLWVGGELRMEPRCLAITTPVATEEVGEVKAKLTLTADRAAAVTLKTRITGPKGEVLAESAADLALSAGNTTLDLAYTIENPPLWDTETPNLCFFDAAIFENGELRDTHRERFGIRTIYADSKVGFLLNGKSMKWRGGCIHHDNAGLGAAAFPAAERRKIEKLKAAGLNAIRTAHNPPSLAMLDVCDELGMLVNDEAFDMWNMPNTRYDYSLWFADWWQRDLKDMIERDRNHPSVISYSIGNEITERDGRSDGYLWSKKLADEVRRLDDTRFVTSGICGMWYKPDEDAPEDYKAEFYAPYTDPGSGDVGSSWDERTEKFMEPLDIVGYNYLYPRYQADHERYPDRVMWGSETHALKFYDSWKIIMESPYVLGDFNWTAYDNLGEAGAGKSVWARDGYLPGIVLQEYPWRSCYQGDLDLCGDRRPQSYFRDAIWRGGVEPRIFTTHPEHYGEGFSGTGWHWYDVWESWTFDAKYIGKPVRCEVYTDADEIVFLLNGKRVGTSKPEKAIAALDIPYEPGEVTAIAYKNGEMVGRHSLKTTGAPYKVELKPEKDTLVGDNRDLVFVKVTIVDMEGNRVARSEPELTAIVDGGELVAFFGANPANEDDYTTGRAHAFDGRALAVIRAKNPGSVTLTVGTPGLGTGYVTVMAE